MVECTLLSDAREAHSGASSLIPADPYSVNPHHLVPPLPKRGLKRLTTWTLPFNLVAISLLLGVSSYVVDNPAPQALEVAYSPTAHALALAADRNVRPPTRATQSVRAEKHPAATRPAVAALAAVPVHTFATAPAAPRAVPRRSPRPVVTPKVTAPTCASFASQIAAQAAFDADRTQLAFLDGDGDGVACEQLPGGPVLEKPAPEPRFEAPTAAQLRSLSTNIYGVYTPNAPYSTSELDDFATAAGGKRPNTTLFFRNFSQPYPADAVAKSWAYGALPMITFEPIVQDSTNGQPHLRDITNGAWDDYFLQWAERAKQQGLPFAFRFAHEMNGNWYLWSDARFGNARGDYVAAWQHVHALFANAGVDNAIWVWSVNRIDRLPDKTLARVYPGDDYVDWVGIDGYYRQTGLAPSFDDTFAATLAEVATVAPRKPVALTEVGAGTTEENRTTWIASFFAGLLHHPEIIGFNWFNDYKASSVCDATIVLGCDWRIQFSPATANAFAVGIADDRFGPLARLVLPG